MFIAYKITNLVNGKIYIGITSETVNARWMRHCNHAKNGDKGFLYNAIRKYGKDNFIKEELACSLNWENLCEIEKILISQYSSFNNSIGYNLTKGGEGAYGRVVTHETREKIRKANMGSSTKSKNFPSPYTDEIIWLGETKTLFEWSKILPYSLRVLSARLYKYGWNIEQAFTGVSPKGRECKTREFDFIEYLGVTRSLEDWAEHLGIRYATLYSRLYVLKWSVEKSFTCVYGKQKLYEYNGQIKTVIDWSKSSECLVSYKNLMSRICRGMPFEKAMTNPEKHTKRFEYDDKSLTLAEWELETGTNRKILRDRLLCKWSLERALTEKVNNK